MFTSSFPNGAPLLLLCLKAKRLYPAGAMCELLLSLRLPLALVQRLSSRLRRRSSANMLPNPSPRRRFEQEKATLDPPEESQGHPLSRRISLPNRRCHRLRPPLGLAAAAAVGARGHHLEKMTREATGATPACRLRGGRMAA